MTGQHYTDADVRAVASLATAHGALSTVTQGWRCACGYETQQDGEIVAHQVRVALDAVAPAIAARALREAADAIEETPWEVASNEGPLAGDDDRTWLHGTDCAIRFASRLTRARADEIDPPATP